MKSAARMDYLHVLAARSLGVLQGVRPRLPSLFEPLAATPFDIEVVRAATLGRRVEPDAAPSGRPPGTFRSDAAVEPSHARALGDSFDGDSLGGAGDVRLVSDEHDPLPRHEVGDIRARARAAGASQPRRPSGSTQEIRSESDQGQGPYQAGRVRVVATQPDARAPDRVPVPDDRRWDPAGSSPAERDSVRARIAPAQERLTLPTSRRDDVSEAGAARAADTLPLQRLRAEPVQAIPQRAIRPRVTRPPAAPLRAQKETVVQVTIGRVEVRAVPPPAPAARKPAPAPPLMSLDEHLRRRSGRGA